MYEITSSDTASFKIHSTNLEWGNKAPVIPDIDIKKHQQFSDFILEAGLYQRKASPSLINRILAIADRIPNEEWERIPDDLAKRYRDYKKNI